MTQPAAYVPQTDFQQEETNAVSGRSTVRTAMVDAEFQALSLTLSQILTNLAVIQRDDTALHDQIVTTESLSPQVKTLISTTGINPRGAWLTATAYAIKDVVETGTPTVSYICVTAHTSGTFATDRAAGKWMVLGQEAGTGTFNSLTLSTGGITLGTNNTQDLAATANRFRDGYFGRTLYATTSVVTPLVGTDSATALQFKTGGTVKWIINQGGSPDGVLYPNSDNVIDIGSAAARVHTIFVGTIDSGTAGLLSLRTNNGSVQFVVNHTGGTVVNRIGFTGSISGNGVGSIAEGTDTNIDQAHYSKGTGSFFLGTAGGASIQFGVLHNASANRYITVTGSNGGNPTISTTAGSLLLSSAASPANGITITASAGNQTLAVTTGSLAITPSVIISGNTLQVGTNPASTNACIGVPYNNPIMSRNQANNNDITLVSTVTQNSVNNVVRVGDSASTGVLLYARSGAGVPGTSDIPASTWALWRDTGGATTKLYYNNAGTIQSVALA